MVNLQTFKILIVAEGAAWAGIENHLVDLIPHIIGNKSIVCDVLLFADGALADSLRSKGIRVVIVKKGNFFVTLVHLINHITKNRYNIIHTHSNVALYIGLCLPFFIRRIYWINTQHSKPEPLVGRNKFKGRIAEQAICFFMKYFPSARVIAVSKDLAEWLIRHKQISHEKIRVIRNGISLPKIDNVAKQRCFEKFGYGVETFSMCVVGRLVPVKGHKYLIEALQILSENIFFTKKCQLLVIGDGPLLQELKEQCIEADIVNQVSVIGFRDDARLIMAVSDVIIIPSIHEGIPYTLLEAMALMRPIIASDVGGLQEILTHGHDAHLVPPSDSIALAKAIQFVAEDKWYAKRLATEAFYTVKEKYSAKKMASETVNAYLTMWNSSEKF
ncbi:glycosyltransferase family 4 protein [Desulfobacterales bacterium HSG17]|nr:glycosyltransferase family 4 protein [Desulfobacterales bacterium HSG17]